MNKTKKKYVAPKNPNELIAQLTEEIANVRNGDTSIGESEAICKLAGKVVKTVTTEIAYSKAVRRTPKVDFMGN